MLIFKIERYKYKIRLNYRIHLCVMLFNNCFLATNILILLYSSRQFLLFFYCISGANVSSTRREPTLVPRKILVHPSTWLIYIYKLGKKVQLNNFFLRNKITLL